MDQVKVILGSIADAVIATDADGRVTLMNPAAEAMTGWPEATAVGRPLPDVFNVLDEATRQPADPVRPAWRGGTVSGHGFLLVQGGRERRVEGSVAPIRNQEGTTLGAVLVFRDVSGRQGADELRARLAAIVESSDDAILSKTLEGVIQSWNAAAERVFGYTSEEAIGKPITLIIPPERHDEEREILARIARGERVEHFETVRVSKAGTRIDISLTVSPVRDASGRIVGASKVARDIRDQKRIEALLREADTRKDQFIALLAHELRNPLAPLRNSLQVMRLAGDDPHAIAEARGVMERQLVHMVRLIDDLLDISRINQSKMELRRSRVLLADVVGSAVETARPAIDAAGHGFIVSVPAEPVYLDADLTRLAQVFSNLLTNSAKYTGRGGRIWLGAVRAGDEVRVSVRDTGIGIPAASIPHIFDMFSQVDRSIERSSGGLGIGLALVKGLVEMHGGMVRVESPGPGSGSTFTVTLPVRGHDPEAMVADSADNEMVQTAPRRILVADDNRDSAESMAMLLKLMGHDVSTRTTERRRCGWPKRFSLR